MWTAAYLPLVLLSATAWLKLYVAILPHGEVMANSWYRLSPRLLAQSGLGNLGLLLLLSGAALMMSPVPRAVTAWVGNLAITLLVLANVLHLRFAGDILSFATAGDARQLWMVADSVVELLRAADALLFLELAAALALFPRFSRLVDRLPPADRSRCGPAGRVALAGALLVLAVPVPVVVADRDESFRKTYFRFIGARQIGVINYHVYESGRALYRGWTNELAIDDAERDRALQRLARYAPETPRSALAGRARGRDVIFLMVESLHAFPIGLRIDGVELTPNLNGLAARSLYFENFYSQAWQGRTSDGEFASLQSLHPLPAGSVATTYPDHSFHGLPAVLADRGYDTFSAHAYYGTLWNMRGMHRELGFRRSYFRQHFPREERVGMGLGDDGFLQRSLPLLQGARRPYMAFLMTLSTHHPYKLPDHHREIDFGGLEGSMLARYLHTVRYFDSALGNFVGGLEEAGILDEAVLVVYGDHEAELGPPADLEELLRRNAGFEPGGAGFDARLWRERHRLPLLIHLPGDAGAGEYRVAGGHLDLAPTVLHLLGLEGGSMTTLGEDLLAPARRPVAFRDGGFAQGDTLCLPGTDPRALAHCADVRTGRPLDPAPFAARAAEVRQRLELSDLLLRADLVERYATRPLTAPRSAGMSGPPLRTIPPAMGR